ncbi:MAG: ROK family protein, partial [Oxalobacteraceae bacterium]
AHNIVVEGADGLATELGHIKVADPQHGRLCGCGEHGCLEAYASGRHLPELLREQVRAGKPSPLYEAHRDDLTALGADAIDRAAAGGDAGAQALWDEVAERLGCAIGNVVTVFNPRVLVLGGGVMNSAPRLRQAVTQKLRSYAARPAQTHLQVEETRLGDDSGIIGAAYLALQATP